jgi:hypothetical protein
MSRYFKTPNGYAVLVGIISSPSAIQFVDGWIPNFEDAKWMVDNCGEFRKLICEKGSLTTSTIVNGWIQTIEVNCDFSKDDECTIHNGDFVCEQSMIEDREGYCHIPIFKLNVEIKSAIIFNVHDTFGGYHKFVKVCEVGKEQETISKTTEHYTDIEDWEIIRCYFEHNE